MTRSQALLQEEIAELKKKLSTALGKQCERCAQCNCKGGNGLRDARIGEGVGDRDGVRGGTDVVIEGEAGVDVGTQAGVAPILASSYAQTVARGLRNENAAPSSTSKDRGMRMEKRVGAVAQVGAWSCVGGSRFWRPDGSSSRHGRDEGVWTLEGSSRIWRRKDRKARQDQEGWKEVKRGFRQGRIMDQSGVRVANRFSVLGPADESDRMEVRHLVIGDSRVRPLGRTFCGRKDRCVVRPGAKVADLGSVIEVEMDRVKPDSVIVQVGVNNVGERQSEKTLKDFRSLLERLREARSQGSLVLVTGILPRCNASAEWYSRALYINRSVRKMCSDMGLGFLDSWDQFYSCDRLYMRDGLHLSDEGARVLGAGYRQAIQGN